MKYLTDDYDLKSGSMADLCAGEFSIDYGKISAYLEITRKNPNGKLQSEVILYCRFYKEYDIQFEKYKGNQVIYNEVTGIHKTADIFYNSETNFICELGDIPINCTDDEAFQLSTVHNDSVLELIQSDKPLGRYLLFDNLLSTEIERINTAFNFWYEKYKL